MLNYKMITYHIGTSDGTRWVAEFIKLPGVLGTGKTEESAINDLEVNAKAHVEKMIELKMSVPKSDKK